MLRHTNSLFAPYFKWRRITNVSLRFVQSSRSTTQWCDATTADDAWVWTANKNGGRAFWPCKQSKSLTDSRFIPWPYEVMLWIWTNTDYMAAKMSVNYAYYHRSPATLSAILSSLTWMTAYDRNYRKLCLESRIINNPYPVETPYFTNFARIFTSDLHEIQNRL